MSPKLFILAFIISCAYGLPNLLNLLLPTAEVCVRGDVGYDWHYGTKFSPISSTLPVGHAVENVDFSRGIFSPLSPLFSQLFISLSTAKFNSSEVFTSSIRQVKIQDNDRKGYLQYYDELEDLINVEMKNWNYSKQLDDYNTTFVFLPDSSSMLTSFHNYQYELDGYGVIRFLSFIFSNSPSTPPKFPSLWPWVNAKVNKPKELVIKTDVMVAQELFSITHSPDHLYHNYENQNLTNEIHTSDNEIDYYTNIMNNKLFISEHSKYGFISKIQFGDHLYMSLNATSRYPPNKPYFATKLIGGIKDLLLESITPLEFDDFYPEVSFNITFTWAPLNIVSNSTGKHYSNIDSLYSIEATELLDIVTSWRLKVIQTDPLESIPIAVQARSIQILSSKSCQYIEPFPKTEEFRNDNKIETTENFHHEDGSDEDLFISITSDDDSLKKESELRKKIEENENEILMRSENLNLQNNRGSELGIPPPNHQLNQKLECSQVSYIEQGEVIQVFTSKCAYGYLPPYSVLEMLWEMNFLIMVIAFCFISLVTYFTMGSLVNQLMLEGQVRLPFFVHIREFPLRLRFLFFWPVARNNANNNENN